MRNHKGFLVLEILIAGFILTSSIAASMYLFRTGYDYLEKANTSNKISSKLIQAENLFDLLELQNKSGTEDLGDGVVLKWEAQLLDASKPPIEGEEGPVASNHELFLYRIYFTLDCRGISRSYEVNAFRFKPLSMQK